MEQEVVTNHDGLCAGGSKSSTMSTNDNGVPKQLQQGAATTGNNSISLYVGNNSTVHFNHPSTNSRPTNNQNVAGGNNTIKRAHPKDAVDPLPPKRLRSGNEDVADSPSPPSDNQSTHPCHFEHNTRQRKESSALSKRKGRSKNLKLNAIPNLIYNALKLKLYTLAGDDLKGCINLIKEDCQGFGIREQTLNQVKSGEDFIKLMVKKNLLSPDNLCLLQMVLHLIGSEYLLKEVNEYAKIREGQPITLHITHNEQPDGTRRVEFRIEGHVKHIRNKNVKAFKLKMAKNLGLKPHQIQLIGEGSGSVMLIFQMPETAINTLRQQIKACATWLKESGVLGVHIEGDEYKEITPTKSKGTMKFCEDCKSSFLQEFFSHLICTRSQDMLSPVQFQDMLKIDSKRSSTCAGCSQTLKQEDLVYSVKDHLYHKDCFSCTICCQPISPGDELFMRTDQKLLCLHDFKAIIRKDIKTLKIFAGIDSEGTRPLDTTKPLAAEQTINLPKTITNEQACHTELPVADQINNQLGYVAPMLTSIEWSKVCASLGLKPSTNSSERKKTRLEELITWKQNLLEQGVGSAELRKRLLSSMGKADRLDLAKYLYLNHQMKGFDLEQCKRELQHYYLQHLCRVPLHCSNEYISIDDIYTDVSLSVNVPKPCQSQKFPLESYQEIFSSKVYSERPPRRIVLSGLTGSGKTTLISKLAYDWATNAEASPLKDVSLLFVLNMREVGLSTNIEDAILTQLLPEDTKITLEHLKEYISRHSSQMMLILDGFTEAHSSSFVQIQRERKGSIIKATSSKILRECRILVTTRSLYAEFYQGFTTIEVNGFSAENVKRYIKKFFVQYDELGEKLISYISSNEIIESIAYMPLVLRELCLDWYETRGAYGIKISRLYMVILKRLYHQSKSYRSEEFDVKKLGKIAFKSMCSTALVTTGRESPNPVNDEVATSSILEVACRLGLMVSSDCQEKTETQRRLLESEAQVSEETNRNDPSVEISKTYVRQVHFFHKTVQEFCAAIYLASVLEVDRKQFLVYLRAYNDVSKALQIQSILKFACGISANAAKIILHGLLEIFSSQLEHSIDDYHNDDLPFEETCIMQDFILLCLICNYEADAMGRYNSLLSRLFPDGKMKFVGISYRDAVAVGYFLHHSLPHSVKSIKLQAVPKADNTVKPDALWKSIQCRPHRWPKPVSKLSSLKTVTDCLDSLESDMAVQYRVMATETPLKVTSFICLLRSCNNLPSETPYTLEPIIYSLHNIQVESLYICGFKIEKKNEQLLKIIELGLIPYLSKLKLSDAGLKGRQTERLAESLVYLPDLKELVLSHNQAGHCLPILGASLTMCKSLRVLDINHMQASAEDMVKLLQKFPEFGSELVNFYMTGNQTSDAVVYAFLEYVPKSCTLIDFGISLGDVSRHCHKLLLQGIRDLNSLQVLDISQSAFPDDLLFCIGDLYKSIRGITSLSLEVDIDVLPQIKHSTWVEFRSKLRYATKLKKMFLNHIALEKGDFEELIEVGHQQKLTHLRYYTSCLPEDTVVKPDYDFLELL